MVKVSFRPIPAFELFEVCIRVNIVVKCLVFANDDVDVIVIPQPMGKPVSRNSSSLSRRHLPTPVLVSATVLSIPSTVNALHSLRLTASGLVEYCGSLGELRELVQHRG